MLLIDISQELYFNRKKYLCSLLEIINFGHMASGLDISGHLIWLWTITRSWLLPDLPLNCCKSSKKTHLFVCRSVTRKRWAASFRLCWVTVMGFLRLSLSPRYLSMPVAVLALLPDPVDGVEVLVGAQAGQRVLQGVHQLGGAVAVHPGRCSAAVLLVPCWEGRAGSGARGEGEQERHFRRALRSRRDRTAASCFEPRSSLLGHLKLLSPCLVVFMELFAAYCSEIVHCDSLVGRTGSSTENESGMWDSSHTQRGAVFHTCNRVHASDPAVSPDPAYCDIYIRQPPLWHIQHSSSFYLNVQHIKSNDTGV